jgi:two-component system sensor histidine kinase/response regulator
MKLHRRFATRLSAVLVVIVSVSALIMGVAITRSGSDLLLNAATTRLAQESRLVSVRLQDTLDSVQRDVTFIANSPSLTSLTSMLDDQDTAPEQTEAGRMAKSRLQDMFAALIFNHPWYAQIRLIGVADQGREIVRVEQGAHGILRVPGNQLQHKGVRKYFQNALEEPPGKVFWSAIELNRENGKLSVPDQPVLRAAMPVAGKYGTPVGIVIINVDIRRVFDTAREVLSPDITLYVANQSGDYLYHPDTSKTFGFEHGQRYLIQQDFTDEALKTDTNSSLVLQDVQPQGQSEPVIAHLSRLSLQGVGADSMIIALTRPRAQVLADIDKARQHSTGLIAPFVVVALFIVIWMVELFTGPLERITREVSRYVPGRRLFLAEQQRKDEVGQLAQAFARMAERIDQQVLQLQEQNERFRSLFEAVPDAVVIIDENGSVEYTNPGTHRLFGYSPDELRGQNIRILMPEPYRSHHDQYMNRYLEGGEAHIIGIGRKVVGLHKSGKTLPLYLSIGEFRLQGRRKFTGILHDISLRSIERQPA